MIKLFALILATSDVGSLSISQIVTDFPDVLSCQRAVERIYHAPQKELVVGGHSIAVKIVAECI